MAQCCSCAGSQRKKLGTERAVVAPQQPWSEGLRRGGRVVLPATGMSSLRSRAWFKWPISSLAMFKALGVLQPFVEATGRDKASQRMQSWSDRTENERTYSMYAFLFVRGKPGCEVGTLALNLRGREARGGGKSECCQVRVVRRRRGHVAVDRINRTRFAMLRARWGIGREMGGGRWNVVVVLARIPGAEQHKRSTTTEEAPPLECGGEHSDRREGSPL
jgi:hypothetical protein